MVIDMAKMNVGIEASSWINIAAGLVAAYTAYLYTSAYETPFYSGLVAGIVLVAVGAFTAWAAATDRGNTALWPSVLTLIAGVWMMAYPWFAGQSNAYTYWQVGTGFVAGVTSVYEIYKANQDESFRSGRPIL